METAAILAIISLFTTFVSAGVTMSQQNKEFDMQKKLLEDQQDFTAERQDLAYARQKPQQVYQDYLDAGFNPTLAANAVLGGATEVADGSSAPAAPSTNSAINALSQMMSQGGKSLYDIMRERAEINNIEANTTKQEVETGLLPRDYELRKLSTMKQLEVWNESVKKIAAETKLTTEQTNLVREQQLYYGRKTEAEITALTEQANKAIADAKLALEQINTEKAKQADYAADVELKGAQTDLTRQQEIQTFYATQNIQEENALTHEKAARERIARQFEESMAGVPLTASAQQYVQKLAKDGKYDEIALFYQGIFTTSLNQSIGEAQGEFGYLKYNHKHNYFFRPMNGGLFELANPSQSGAFWNPNNR